MIHDIQALSLELAVLAIKVTCEYNNVACRRTKYATIDPIYLNT